MFWEKLGAEHGISLDGTLTVTPEIQASNMNQHIYYRERADHYTPRTILVGTSYALDPIQSSALSRLFDSNSFAESGLYDNLINWEGSFHCEESNAFVTCVEALRREMESCERVCGFQICSCLGENIGSGFASRLMNYLREAYPSETIWNFSVFPKVDLTQNMLMSIPHLVEHSDACVVLDESSILTKIEIGSTVNSTISDYMGAITSPWRYSTTTRYTPSNLAQDLKLSTNLHFLTGGMFEGPTTFQSLVERFIHQHDNNPLCPMDPSEGAKFISSFGVFNSITNPLNIEDELNIKEHFLKALPNPARWAILEDVNPPSRTLPTTFLANSTGIGKYFVRLLNEFDPNVPMNREARECLLHLIDCYDGCETQYQHLEDYEEDEVESD